MPPDLHSPNAAVLAESAGGYNRLKKCRRGFMHYNLNDTYVGRSLDFYGEYSEGEVEIFSQVLQPGDIVLEIGANIGVHTVWLAQAVAPNGVVLAFEPQRLIYQTLCANVAVNSLTNVVCHQVAVASKSGEMTVPVFDPRTPDNFGGISLEGHASGEPVSVITLDEIPMTSCKLIKIDVEGMELSVLQGGRALIGRLKPILYVENDRKDRSAELIRFIDSMDYSMYWHRPRLFNPNNYYKKSENIFGEVASSNMFCVPKGSQVSGLPPVEIP